MYRGLDVLDLGDHLLLHRFRQKLRFHQPIGIDVARRRPATGIEEDLGLGAQDGDGIVGRRMFVQVLGDQRTFDERICVIDPSGKRSAAPTRRRMPSMATPARPRPPVPAGQPARRTVRGRQPGFPHLYRAWRAVVSAGWDRRFVGLAAVASFQRPASRHNSQPPTPASIATAGSMTMK